MMNILLKTRYLIVILLISFSFFCSRSVYEAFSLTQAKTLENISPIIVYGDTRDGHDIHRQIVRQMLLQNPKAVFHTGDLVSNGTDSMQWVVFNDITGTLRKSVPFYPSIGNHERNSHFFYDNFTLPNNEQWYSVVIDNQLFIVLNINSELDTLSEQFIWLKNELNKSKKEQFIAFIFHYPVFSHGRHGGMNEKEGNIITKICKNYDVEIVFNGHDHDYERTEYQGVQYLVTGGGGAPLREKGIEKIKSVIFASKYHFCRIYPENENFRVDVIDEKGNQFDTFIVK